MRHQSTVPVEALHTTLVNRLKALRHTGVDRGTTIIRHCPTQPQARFLTPQRREATPPLVTFVPLFVLVANLGMLNSYGGLILPFLTAPLGVFLMRQFISGLPDDLIEAARIDGAGELRIFARVIMPLCGPAVATLTILSFLGSWNNFLWPLVVAQTQNMYTLPVAIALFSIGQDSNHYGLMMAGSVVIVVPVLAVFVALQRYFIQGIAMTGIK